MNTNEIISYDLSLSPNLEQVKRMLDKAFGSFHDLRGLILHSDQGWQYQHVYFRDQLKKHGVIQSMSRKGNCYDNCIMETFFGRMKNEMFYGYEKEYSSFDEFQRAVKEIIDFLQIRPGQKGLDATLGYGGHTTEMLKCLEGEGHIYGLDIDPIEIEKTKKRLEQKGFDEKIFTAINTNFKNIDQVAKEHGPFDFILADLGVSSMQIDNPERGFSYKYEGPLDLRLNPTKGISAAQRIADISLDELEGMLIENSDEPYAYEVAKAVIDSRRREKIETTTQLREIIEKALQFLPAKERKDEIKKCCARTFQALRIDVNSEFEVLYDFLEKLPDALNPGGRVAILTFHSGEDRLVKKSFKALKKAGIYSDVANEVIRPSREECNMNPRAKSTKMRWAVKL